MQQDKYYKIWTFLKKISITFQNFSKNVINDLYEHYTTGASPGFERGGGKNFFFGFRNLHVAFAMRIARGQGRKSRGGWGVCSPHVLTWEG